MASSSSLLGSATTNSVFWQSVHACLSAVSCITHGGLSRLSRSTLIVQRILIPHSKLLNSTGSIQIQAPCCVCHLPDLRIWLQFFIRSPHIYLLLCSPLNYWDLLVVIRPWSTVRTTDCLPMNTSCWPSYRPASPRKQPNQAYNLVGVNLLSPLIKLMKCFYPIPPPLSLSLSQYRAAEIYNFQFKFGDFTIGWKGNSE